jgi:hypothetical protein
MGPSPERKPSRGEANHGLGLTLTEGSKKSIHFRKRSVAVKAGKVKEMVEKFNGVAIQEEPANETDVNAMIKRVSSKEHTPTKNIQLYRKEEEIFNESDETNGQDDMAASINESPTEEERYKRVGEARRGDFETSTSLGPKDNDAESVQSLGDPELDEILNAYDTTQNTISKDALNDNSIATASNSPRDQDRLATDSSGSQEDVPKPSTSINKNKYPEYSSISEFFDAQCTDDEPPSGIFARATTRRTASSAQESTIESYTTNLERHYFKSSSIYPLSAQSNHYFQEDVPTPDISVLARAYSDLIGPISSLDDEDEDMSFHSSSSASSELQLPQHLTSYHNLLHLNSPSTSPLLLHSPNETRSNRSHTLSNASSTYSTDNNPPSICRPDNDSSSDVSSTSNIDTNHNSRNNFPPLRHHGRHQITELLSHSPNSTRESTRFPSTPCSESLPPSSPSSSTTQQATDHPARPPSSISQISVSNTAISSDSTLDDSLPFTPIFVYDAESRQMDINQGQSSAGQWVTSDGTIWEWDRSRWIACGRRRERSAGSL